MYGKKKLYDVKKAVNKLCDFPSFSSFASVNRFAEIAKYILNVVHIVIQRKLGSSSRVLFVCCHAKD